MSRNTTTTTTNTPDTTMQRTKNHTLVQTTRRTRSSTASTKLLPYNPYINTAGPESAGMFTFERIFLISGLCAAALFLILVSLVVTLIIFRKQRRKRQRRNETLERDAPVTSGYNNAVMEDIKMAIAKKRKADKEEYDYVVSTNRDDEIYEDDFYEYVRTKGNVPHQYKSLGPQDAANIYEQISRNSAESATVDGTEYQNYTENQSKNEKNEDAYENQVEETTEDGYLMPVPSRNEVDESVEYSDAYVKVLL